MSRCLMRIRKKKTKIREMVKISQAECTLCISSTHSSEAIAVSFSHAIIYHSNSVVYFTESHNIRVVCFHVRCTSLAHHIMCILHSSIRQNEWKRNNNEPIKKKKEESTYHCWKSQLNEEIERLFAECNESKWKSKKNEDANSTDLINFFY